MASPQRTSSVESVQDGSARKRVCKACDRCRLKKSKCDGANPCSRCKADNAICVFGERKRAHDKVYPKGYVEMLEGQQAQLVAGLRELYRRLLAGESWPGKPLLDQHNGHPLTHDILERLDLLHIPGESNTSSKDIFEEDLSRMQQRLIDSGAPMMQRRGSVSSDSEHGHSTASYDTSPSLSSPFSEQFIPHHRAPLTPPTDSPFPRQSQLAKQPNFGTLPMMPVPGITAMNAPWMPPQQPMVADERTMDFLGYDPQMQYADPTMSFDNPFPEAPHGAQVAMTDWEPNDVDFNSFLRT